MSSGDGGCAEVDGAGTDDEDGALSAAEDGTEPPSLEDVSGPAAGVEPLHAAIAIRAIADTSRRTSADALGAGSDVTIGQRCVVSGGMGDSAASGGDA